MKVFLSSLENAMACGKNAKSVAQCLIESGVKMKYNLMSYFYIKNKTELAEMIRDNTEEIMIDSGAHTLRHGVKTDFEKYAREYADFIRKFDRPNVIGYFEMDIDNIVGYEKVLELRKILEEVSDKIIPVWHPNRGIEDFKEMCRTHQGKVVSITGFQNVEIREEQYIMFLKYARQYNCKLHCLGMTRKKVLDKVPFDYVDSSSWVQSSVFGRIDGKGKVTRDFSSSKREIVFMENYKNGMKMQKKYYDKWRKVCKD